MAQHKPARRKASGDQFRMPAEWEPHEGTWLGWPHELTDWPGKFAPIPWVYAEIVRHLARVERVFLIVEDAEAEARARGVIEKSGVQMESVEFFHVPTDRGWMRDSGPIGVRQFPSSVIPRSSPGRTTRNLSSSEDIAATDAEERFLAAPRAPAGASDKKSARDFARNGSATSAWLNFVFNGWAKYDDHKKDARVVERLNRRLKQRVVQPVHKGRRVVLEGGAIDVNGRGTLLTTEECLLSGMQERNPGFTRADYEELFRRYFGATNILWLKNGIAGDDTHGHIDDLARFVDATTVVTVVEHDHGEVNYAPLRENLKLLRGAVDQDGKPLRVETLPMPEPVYFAGQRLPASYANFYVANKIVLVPVFNDPADRIALAKLASLFLDREIVPIYARDLVLGLGTIHCMTQQIPRG